MTETAPTNLIALRDGKTQAEALISARFSEGLIDQDELEQRLEAVVDATTMAGLERTIVDRARARRDRLRPALRVRVGRGRVVFASLQLCERELGERGKDARRRHKSARKRRRRALPERT